METILSRNPASGAVLRELQQTPLEAIPALITQAREAQKNWAVRPVKERIRILLNAREFILENLDAIANLVCEENGKPKFEAIANDLLPAMELMTTYCARAPKLLRSKKISLRWAKHRKSHLQFWPKGVVAIISPWNYPFSIPFGEIALALLAGNAVVFKPSEVTPLTGLKIAEIFDEACLPPGLLQVVLGDGSRGAAIIKAKADKICFTGSVATGKKVMAAAAENLTPVLLELGGKDPMIVLPDADLDYATSAALWGGFSNSGQACASIERILVHEKIHDEFVKRLHEKVRLLTHVGNDEAHAGDLGAITFENQKLIYTKQLEELNAQNARIVCGGSFSDEGRCLEPTIVTNPSSAQDNPIETTKIYNEETFGPVVAVTKYKTTREAIEKANRSRYGLLASVIGRDLALAEQIAGQIEAGSVLINEVLYTHGLSETPWGGLKDSGFGRVHSDAGFYEFVNVRHVHQPRPWLPAFKSPWWFPYSQHQMSLFRAFAEVMYRRSILRKIKALPNLIVEFVQMIKSEKRY
ncbi:MAG: aldehyde dehydrogenase family protein [Deltaproteobacteria bacterium]|nr:aldehyde dehydrogenase family protein [Deltaproteobacteria bacterium]